MSLDSELVKHRANVRSQAYSMSIGELVSMYQSGELQIDPIFQRHMRWETPQKVSFIESILLELPLPAIYVVTNDDGTWELLDGLQRFAAILQFMGLLKDPDGNPAKPLVLTATDMLPDLDGVVYGKDDEDNPKALSAKYRIDFRRQKFDVKIILDKTSEQMVLEMFLRLNSGSAMTAQEVRNAIINKKESNFWIWFEELARFEPFLSVAALSDRDLEESYNVELLLRLIGISRLERRENEAMPVFLDRIVRQDELYALERDDIEQTFKEYFNIVSDVAGEDPFRSKGRSFNANAFDELAVPHMKSGLPFDANKIKADFEAFHTRVPA